MRVVAKGFLKKSGVILFMTLLLGLLMCPHGSFGAERDCITCAVGLECPDLCDCSANAGSHEHEFRDDTSQIKTLDLMPPLAVSIILPFDTPQRLRGDSVRRASSPNPPSHTLWHLNTIILRI